MDEVIISTDGILAEFIGDAILALWNCPQDVRQHGERCIEAAVGMQERCDTMKAEWLANGYPEIKIRVGVHTSDVFVGNIGSRERMKYGVLGDGVNLASRLEELNKRYTTRVSQRLFVQALLPLMSLFHTNSVALPLTHILDSYGSTYICMNSPIPSAMTSA
jgi:class 3 adenylate cyclase